MQINQLPSKTSAESKNSSNMYAGRCRGSNNKRLKLIWRLGIDSCAATATSPNRQVETIARYTPLQNPRHRYRPRNGPHGRCSSCSKVCQSKEIQHWFLVAQGNPVILQYDFEFFNPQMLEITSLLLHIKSTRIGNLTAEIYPSSQPTMPLNWARGDCQTPACLPFIQHRSLK